MDENNKDKIPKPIFKLRTIEEQNKIAKNNKENLKKNSIHLEVFPDKKSTKQVNNRELGIEIPVHKNAKVIINKKLDISFDTKLQLLRVLEIDKEYPDSILGFNPPLFKEFITKTGEINTHVYIGQAVKLKLKFKKDINEKQVVKDLYFTSLNNMTVIIAKLENGNFYPSYQLEAYDS